MRTGKRTGDLTLRWCPDGHTWTDHADGTVSPSWGLGGTHFPVDDPLRCPEPRRNDEGEIWCQTCADWKISLSDCLQGLSFSPWEKHEWCEPPPPACLKPAVGDGHRWDDQYKPFDDARWCAWWVRKHGPWRLTFHSGCSSRSWAATYHCLDVHTGETFHVERTWSARRARLDEYPAHLRERWWKTDKGNLIGCWSTMAPGGAGWLLDRRQVEAWIREAVEGGVAADGQQLAFDLAG